MCSVALARTNKMLGEVEVNIYSSCEKCTRIVYKKNLCLLCFRVSKEKVVSIKVQRIKKQSTSDELIQELLEDPRYKISPDGYVETIVPPKGKAAVPWRLINPSKTFQGYFRITYKAHTIQLHRIIYAACNGPLKPRRVINHIDGNPSNNRADNLEQMTIKKNLKLSKNRETPRKKYSEIFKNLVRDDHKKGLSYRELSLKYSIAKGTVYNFLFPYTKKLVA